MTHAISPNYSSLPRAKPAHVPAGAVRVVSAAAALAILRTFSSYSWLSGALIGKDAKFSSVFLSGEGLIDRITDPKTGFAHSAVTHEISNFLTTVVVPHATFFAWTIALSELFIGLSLLLGIFTRLGGAGAILRAITNVLVAGFGAETVGHNYMLALAGAVVLLAAAGRAYGLDKLLLEKFPHSRLLRVIS